MNLGAPEILLILVVALLVFGPQKLPEIGRQVGGAMRELRRMQDSVKSELQTAMQEDAPVYDKPVSPPRPEITAGSEVTASTLDEPDHTDQPPGDFEGPSGSFR
jgi:sec-independent protein translocase protein TatA